MNPGTSVSPSLSPAGTPPRVAVVVTQLGYGGAEKQTYELLRALAGTPEAPVLVICLSEDLHPYGPQIEALGYRMEVIPRQRSFDAIRWARLRRLLLGSGIHVVHAVHLLASAYSFLALWPRRRPRLLPCMRGGATGTGRIRHWTYRRMFRSCPFALVNSLPGTRTLVETLGAPSERLVIIPNGIDFASLRQQADPPRLRKELGLTAETPLVGFVGKNSRVKNVPRFLQTCRQLFPRFPNLQAVLIGTGLDESARTGLAPDLPATQVHFLGARSDLPSLVADLDLLLLTSESEGCPNIVLEALGLGIPVVATDVGDIRLMIGQESCGAVVPREDQGELVLKAGQFLANGRGNRPAVRGAWPRLERDYSLVSMVEQTTRLWRTLAGAMNT